jgi:DNA-directed RNA polymerase specialized sigma24 family protein
MMPLDPQASKPARTNSEDRPRRESIQAQWTLTQEAFDKLLVNLSPDREEAGRQYEIIRNKILRYLRSRGIESAEARADETINRVARRIDEGQVIANLMAYIYRVAYLIFLETLKEPEHTEINLDDSLIVSDKPQFEENEQERRQNCFDACMKSLTTENRELILGYYQETGGVKIEVRRQLAIRLSIPLNALRIRAHRIRVKLETCIKECLGQPSQCET